MWEHDVEMHEGKARLFGQDHSVVTPFRGDPQNLGHAGREVGVTVVNYTCQLCPKLTAVFVKNPVLPYFKS